MARIADHIRSVDNVSPVSGLSVPDAPVREELPRDGGIVPWLWIGAWLLGWAILLAFAAFWIGEAGVRARDIWIWIGLWLAGGLAVAALMVRMAAKDTERAYTLRRLSTARREIAQLEAQLQTSTRSLFGATQTLTEATDLLLEQVDTSRDDLRNQIRSAQDLADSLRTQTEGLVSARETYLDSMRSEVAPSPILTEDTDRGRISLPPSEDSAESETPDAPDATTEPEKLPPLGLRPAPESEDIFLAPESEPEPLDIVASDDDVTAPVEASVPSRPGGWEWKDMLSNVDAAVKPSDDNEHILASLRASGLAPEVIVDEGNAIDALNTWDTAGLPAMGQLLSIRFDEPARVYRDVLRADAELESVAARFSEARASRLATASRQAREADLATDAGRAWMFIQAVLAL